jgi:hypothetical protein
MSKKCIWLMTLVAPLFVFTVPANACKVVGYRNGEPVCMTTSDGKGQPYTDARPSKNRSPKQSSGNRAICEGNCPYPTGSSRQESCIQQCLSRLSRR